MWAIVFATVAHTGAPGVVAAAPPVSDSAAPVGAPPDDSSPAPTGPTGSSGTTWGIQPSGTEGTATRPSFVYEVEPGSVVDDSVRITNFSDQPLTLRVSGHDAFNTGTGGFDVLAAGVTSTGVGSWLTLATDAVVVPAQDAVDVPFRLTVPSNASPGDHAGGIVASMTMTATQADGTAVLVDNRVGTRIYVRVAGPLRPSLVVTSFTVDYEPQGLVGLGGTLVADYTVRNAGNVRLTAGQRIDVVGAFGAGRRAVDVEDMPELLPGGEYSTTVRIDGTRPFVRLVADLEITPAGPTADETTVVDDVPPPFTSRATTWAVPWRALVVSALIAAALLWRRRNRRRAAGAAAEPAADPEPDPDPATSADSSPEPEPSGDPESDPDPTPTDPTATPASTARQRLARRWRPTPALAVAAGMTISLMAVAVGPLPAGAAPAPEAGAQIVRIEPTSVAVGGAVTIELAGWPSGPAQFEVCGNSASRGSTDCDLFSAGATAVGPDGSAGAAFVIGAPPAPCPCVVRVTQAHTAATATIPIEIVGIPAAIVGQNLGPVPAPERRLEIVSTSIELDEGPAASFGADARRRVTVTVRNTGTVTIDDVVLTAQLFGGINSSAIIESPDGFDLEPGMFRDVELSVGLPAPAFGDYRVVGRVDGGDEPVEFSMSTSHMPWGLVNGVILAVIALAVLGARRRFDQRTPRTRGPAVAPPRPG
ncbi:MAG TPA: DUF916 domain-containing protein [Ilumatobacteraceae bacterium]|nr:DUF916 domain-containing protein [Ilumatobacteraceae bacterium]